MRCQARRPAACDGFQVVRQPADVAMTQLHLSRQLQSKYGMYLIVIAWIYVVLMMSVAEAISTQGTVLGALITFVLYGVMPLSIVVYIMGTPGRRRARRAAESAQEDGGGHSSSGPGDTAAAERKEP